MSSPDAESDPFLPGDEVAQPAPTVLWANIHEEALATIEGRVQAREGISIYELAQTKPHHAFVEVGGLFRKQFIDAKMEEWAIGSPEEDGQLAFDGLTRYMKERTMPDPDVEEVEVVISVFKRNPSRIKRLFGYSYTLEEAIRFQAGPQDLAF